MKKIGLAVCYDTKNFGSQLQVLATVNKIEKAGYSTEIIRYNKKLSLKFVAQTIPRLLNPYFIKGKIHARRKKREIERHPEVLKNVSIRNNRFSEFVEKFFTNLSEPYNGWQDLVACSAQKYDAFVCGSDQLWLPSNLGSHFYTLEFAPDNKEKIAYATSFGVSAIPWYQKRRTANYLKKFSFLSTRELTGSKIIKELTGLEAEVVCDPTLLLDNKEWLELIPNRKIVDSPYIFCYFLGTNIEHRKAAEEFSKQFGIKIVSCPFLDNFVEYDLSFGDERLFDVDAGDFVNLIRNADFILTDSFHGSVFSVINKKRFLTFNRFKTGANSRNSRIDSFCELLGLSDRRYTGDVEKVTEDINYDSVDEKLLKLRQKSFEYLSNALQGI